MARSLRKEFLNAPNAITLVRIAMIPVILYFTYVESRVNSFVAGLVYAVTGTTDFLDGWIARKKGLITVIGKFLDPLADKLIVMAALVMLVHLGRVPAWIVIVIMAREFMVTGLRTIAMSEGIVIAAGQEGKHKTAFQVAAITIPSLIAMVRSPVTMNSRAMITITTHAATRPRWTSITSAAITMSLSASGSRNFPITVTSPFFRAIQPSRKSVVPVTA